MSRHRLNTVSRKADSARPPKLDRRVVPRILQSKVTVELWELSAVLHHHQSAQVHVSVAAAQSTDSLATANLARRLRVRVPVNCEAEKNADNPESIDLLPHRLPVQVQAKREVPMVNLAASQEVERLLQLSTGKGSRSAERKRARGPRRHEDHNNFSLIILAAPEHKSGAAFVQGRVL
jgi:hypothetical protein